MSLWEKMQLDARTTFASQVNEKVGCLKQRQIEKKIKNIFFPLIEQSLICCLLWVDFAWNRGVLLFFQLRLHFLANQLVRTDSPTLPFLCRDGLVQGHGLMLAQCHRIC